MIKQGSDFGMLNTITTMKKWLFASCLSTLVTLTYAQNDSLTLDYLLNKASEKEQLFECSNMMNDGYFYQASMVCDKLIERQPASCNYNFRKGYVLMELSSDYVHALPYLRKSVEQTSKIWDQYNEKETKAPTDAYFVLAKCYQLNLQVDSAVYFYQKFIETSNPKSPNILLARLYIKQCSVAKYELEHPKTARIQNLEAPINSPFPDFSPVISLDGSALYYTSRRNWQNGASNEYRDERYNTFPEDIYVSYKNEDSTWTDPARLDFCAPAQNEATMAVSPDERRIYLYQDTEGNGDIFYSNITNERFKVISHIDNKKINSSNWETHCTVTPDGKTMYFVSNRDEGYGGRDIYRCEKFADGSWDKPVNCGPIINSAFDEESPFISIDNKTLYFSSNCEKSMGGFDIFQTILDTVGKWSEPVNLGYPFNSTGDDLFYTTTFDGYTGYLTSIRPEGKGEKDIYEIKNNYLGIHPLAVLKGNIRVRNGAKMPEDIAVELVCKNGGKTSPRLLFPRFRDGFFMADLGLCAEYEMVYTSNNGKNEIYRDGFKTNCNYEQEEVYKEVWLDAATGKISRLYFIDGTIADSKTKRAVSGVTVQLTDKNSGDVYFNSASNQKGFFLSDSVFGKNPGDETLLQLVLTKEGYAPTTIDLPITFGTDRVIHLNELIDPMIASIQVGTDLGISINPIYFDYRKWNIRPDAAAELDKIVKIMKDNPGIKIALGSHTDARGSDQDNLVLSQKRARSSVDYIVSKGISRSRITGKGYGETQLNISNEEIEAVHKWEEQEKLHQLNRRTEFIIVK